MLQRIVFLFFFILPFQWALSPVPGIDLALARVLSMLIFFVWVFSSVFKKRLMLPDGLSSFLASSFLFISALSFLWAGNADFSVRKIAFLFSFFPSFFVLTSFFKENINRVQTTLSFFIYGSVIAAAVSLVQFFSQFIFGVEKVFSFWTGSILPFFLGSALGDSVAAYPSLLVNISGKTLLRATGFFPDPHMFSFYMGISILLTLGMFFSQRERKWGYAFWILLVADLLAFSRGGYLGLCAGVTFFLFTFFYQKGLGVRGLLTGAGIFGIIFLTAWSPIGARFGSTFSTEDGSNKERIRLWEEALGHISERPFLGVGLGNYPLLVKPSAGYGSLSMYITSTWTLLWKQACWDFPFLSLCSGSRGGACGGSGKKHTTRSRWERSARYLFFRHTLFLSLPFSYLRIKFYSIPFYLPELMVTMIGALFLFRIRQKEDIQFSLDKTMLLGALFFLGGAALSFLTNPLSSAGLGILKAWFVF